ncbi:hypothetical protein [Pseudoalteromonas sp. T1lg10]|uniref:hypothetical protein n=1 Tax=Pseudoalteromonas sp. T1lg10 TaxID=2077093 RepID=UPI000CF66B0E|nr:hypothetical protein [Pseudoalteromonas sp. T1lg10]
MTRSAFVIRLMVLGVCSLFVACGGSDGDSAPPVKICTQTSLYYCPASAFNDPFGIALTIAWYTGQCTREVFCEEDGNVPDVDPDNGIIDDDFISKNWTTQSLQEREPNNEFEQATPFILRPSNGVLITGELDAASDKADIFAFIMDGQITVSIYLCSTPSTCTQPFYNGPDLYIELYNANEVLLDSTETPNELGHVFTGPQLLDGEQYFIAVRIRDAAMAAQEYKLVITD